jgi:uncharacterized OB-fold protein
MRLAWQPDDLPSARSLWAGAAEGRLVLPWCAVCDAPVTYPRDFCPRCHGIEVADRELSGRGTVYSFGIETRAQPGCDLVPPFVVALVDLEEGGRLVSNVLADPDTVAIGQAVRAVFAVDEDGRSIPRFAPDTTTTDRTVARSNP